jgi:nucleoid-associated protein YgaU
MKILGGTELQWILSSFNTTYKMFNTSGVPVRAEMKISLTEYATEQMLKDRSRLQSPDHEKAYRVQPGDTLQSIAWHHYDDASLWRPIASANNIEDPRDVEPGLVLRVPRIR